MFLIVVWPKIDLLLLVQLTKKTRLKDKFTRWQKKIQPVISLVQLGQQKHSFTNYKANSLVDIVKMHTKDQIHWIFIKPLPFIENVKKNVKTEPKQIYYRCVSQTKLTVRFKMMSYCIVSFRLYMWGQEFLFFLFAALCVYI